MAESRYFGIGLDNSQLKKQLEEAKKGFKSLSDEALKQAGIIDGAFKGKTLSANIKKEFEQINKMSIDLFGGMSENTQRLTMEMQRDIMSLSNVEKMMSALNDSYINGTITQTEFIQSSARLAVLHQEISKAIQKNEQALREENQMVEKLADDSMLALQQRITLLTTEYMRFSEAQRSGAAGEEQLKKIADLQTKLQQAQATMQQYGAVTRRTFDGLSFSVSQLARELPSLTMGPQMFFLAISNNLPIFMDELARARKEYQELTESGKSSTPVWKQVMKSFASWNTLLSVGITLLITYGDKVVDFVKKLISAEEANELTEDAISNLAQTISELNEQLDTENRNIDKLFDSLRRATKGTGEYESVKAEILDKYGEYLQNLSDEVRSLDDVATAYRAIKKAAEEAARARALEHANKESEDTYTGYTKNVAKNMLDALKGEKYKGTEKEIPQKEAIRLIGQFIKDIRTLGDLSDESREKLRALGGRVSDSGHYLGTLSYSLNELIRRTKEYNTEQELLNSTFGNTKNMFEGLDIKTLDNIISKINESYATLSESKSGKISLNFEDFGIENYIAESWEDLNYIKDMAEQARKKVASTAQEIMKGGVVVYGKKGLNGAIDGQARAKEIAAQQQEIMEMQLRQAREYARMNEDIEYKAEQARINAMRDGAEKTRAQRELNNKKELDDIERQKQDYIQKVIQAQKEIFDAQEKLKKEQDSKYTPKVFDPSTVTVDTSMFDNIAAEIERKQENDRLKQQEADWDEAIMRFGTYQQKKLAIERKYDKEIADAQNAGQAWIAMEEKKSALQSLDEQYGKSTQAMADLFEDAGEKSVGEIQKIIDKYELLIKFLSGTEQSDGTAVSTDELKAVGFTDKDIEKIRRGEISINDVTDAVKVLKGELSGKSPWQAFVSDMEKAIDKLKSADGDSKKVGLGIMDIGNAVTSFAPAVGEFANNIASIFGAEDTNITEISNAIGGLGQTAAGVGQILSGDIIGGAMAAVGGISQVVGAIRQIHDKKHEKQIQKLQDQIDALDKSYDKLGRDIEKAYSVDAAKMIEQQNQMLEKQKVLIQGQIAEEQAKKNTDDEKLKEYQDQLDKIDEQLEDNKDKQIEAIAGTSVMSAIDQFAQAYADAWANGTDAAEASSKAVKNLLKTSILNFLKDQLSPDVEQFMTDLAKYMSDGIIDPWEEAQLNKLKEKMDETAANYFDQTGKFIEDDEAKEQQSASGKGFETMSQDTAEELNGRFTALQESGIRIEQKIDLGNVNLEATKQMVREAKDMVQTCVGYLEEIRDNTGAIVQPIKQIQQDIAVVKQNTARL